ncbi:hypothetical protein ABK040_009685 [Willaertia magna]
MMNNSFLFATGIASSMGISRKKTKLDQTKWNEWKFPLHCKTVEKLVCGSNFVTFHNGNEIYYFGGFVFDCCVKENNYWNKFEWKNLLQEKKNLYIKDLFAYCNNLVIQLENDELIIIYEKELYRNTQFINVGIKFISCGPVSNHFIVVDKNEIIHYFKGGVRNDNIDTSEIKTTVKCIGCSEHSIILVTVNNKIYLKTPFEKESEVVDIKCGSCHTVVLLRNGSVYAVGYNNFGQSCIYNQITVTKFTTLLHSLFCEEFIIKIYCCSRGTVLISDKNVAYFIGEPVNTLKGYEKGNSLNKNIESHNVRYPQRNSLKPCNVIQKVKLDKYNDISPAGYGYIIYFNSKLKEMKSLIYFENNLLNLVKTADFNDISFVH